MKSSLLFTTVAFIGLAGLTSAQGNQRRVPDSPANRVTAAQLTQFMQDSTRSRRATVDQWCYAMSQVVAGGYNCPAPENFGFAGRNRSATVDAQSFLNNLRSYEAGASTAPFGPGGGQSREAPGVAACRDAVQDRLRSDGYFDVRIPSINAEDQRRGSDRVTGLAIAQRRSGRSEQFDFSCAVNLERGEVRSVDVNPR